MSFNNSNMSFADNEMMDLQNENGINGNGLSFNGGNKSLFNAGNISQGIGILQGLWNMNMQKKGYDIMKGQYNMQKQNFADQQAELKDLRHSRSEQRKVRLF